MTDYLFEFFPAMTGRSLWADIPLSPEEDLDRLQFNTVGEGAELFAGVLKEVALLRSERSAASLFASLNALDVMKPPKKSVAFAARPVVIVPLTDAIVSHVPVSVGKVSDTLLLHNIPRDCSEAELRAIFAAYGDIVRIAIPIDKNRRSPHFGGVRGFAIIQFASSPAAQTALSSEQSLVLRGKLISIEFSFK
jgi:hypothetical protein